MNCWKSIRLYLTVPPFTLPLLCSQSTGGSFLQSQVSAPMPTSGPLFDFRPHLAPQPPCECAPGPLVSPEGSVLCSAYLLPNSY